MRKTTAVRTVGRGRFCRNVGTRTWRVRLLIATLFVVACGAVAANRASAHGGPGSTPKAKSAPKAKPKRYLRPVVAPKLADHPLEPRYGGQVTSTKWHYFEVVYSPQELRIYVYWPSQRQLNPLYVTGEVSLTVISSGQEGEYPVQYVRGQLFSSEPGYLVAPVDVSRVRDGDMQVEIALNNLPQKEERHASFTQAFALTRPRSVMPIASTRRPSASSTDPPRLTPANNWRSMKTADVRHIVRLPPVNLQR